jgi:hypothetical protein
LGASFNLNITDASVKNLVNLRKLHPSDNPKNKGQI